MTTKSYFDDQGRQTRTTEPGGASHYTVYEDNRTIEFPYWDSVNDVCLMPIRVSVRNEMDQMSETYTVRADYTSISTTTGGDPKGFSTEPAQSDYVSWARYGYNDTTGLLSTVDRYHDIPSTGTGTLSTNFGRTITQTDAMGRNEYTVQVISGSTAADRKEQVTQQVYDVRSRVIRVRKGVSGDSAANSHNMTDGYDSYPTMTTISESQYDDDGVGDGYVTKLRKFHGTGSNDYTGTNQHLTYRGHQRGSEPFYMSGSTETAAGPYTVVDINWQGQVTAQALYKSKPTWSSVLTGEGYTDYATSTATNRGSLREMSYDDLGRSYQRHRFAIDTSTGAKGSSLQSDTWYDRLGRVVGTQKAYQAGTEKAYDGAGRSYQSRTVLDLESTKYTSGAFNYRDPQPNPDMATMTGGDDKLIELSHTALSDSGHPTEEHTFYMTHDDTGASIGIDLSNDDDYIRSSVYSWHDGAGRQTARGDYGSGDTASGAGEWKYASVPSRPSTAPTASSHTVLVTRFSYDAQTGQQSTVTSPDGFDTRRFRDDAGRVTWPAANFDDFVPDTLTTISDGTDDSKDRVTKTEYDAAGNETKIIAYNGSSSAAQETVYLREDTVDASRLTSTIYPDSSDTASSGTDQVKQAYNVDGSRSQQTDQRGTVLDYTYTSTRRPELTKVTTLGGDTDGHVRSIKYAYDDLGRQTGITSYANSDGTGTIRNDVQFELDDLGGSTIDYQSHEGAVNTGTSPKIQYSCDATASSSVFTRNHRLETVTYPSGRIVYLDYEPSSSNDPPHRLSRVRKLRESSSTGTELAIYDYNGRDSVVIADLPEPDIKLDYFQGTSGTYAGLDRFKRIKEQYWDGYNATTDVDRFTYAYDDGDNMTYRDVDSAIYSTNDKDRVYDYDGLARLTASEAGTLSGTSISGTPVDEENWALDQLGTWSDYVFKENGSTALDQSRTSNDANEITDITESTGTAWVTPGYDAAGNMTTIPQPNSLGDSYTATYDPWNRLITLKDGGNTVADYEYDGLNRRIVKSLYANGALTHKRHFYYNERSQLLEVRKETSGSEDADPLEQYIWHGYYVDAPLLRDYDVDVDGTSVRQYYAYDASMTVTSVVDESGAVVERYEYKPHGASTILDADFSDDGDNVSDVDNAIRLSGRRHDAESGLHHFRERQLHGRVGVFLRRDPAGYIDGHHLYRAAFVPNGTDPTGTSKRPWAHLEEKGGQLGPITHQCLPLAFTWKYDVRNAARTCRTGKVHIVQKVSVVCGYHDPQMDINVIDWYSYFEEISVGGSDSGVLTPTKWTWGYMNQTATAHVFCDDDNVTGDIKKWKTHVSIGNHPRHCRTNTQLAKATKDEPRFWQSPESAQPAVREFAGFWFCVCPNEGVLVAADKRTQNPQ